MERVTQQSAAGAERIGFRGTGTERPSGDHERCSGRTADVDPRRQRLVQRAAGKACRKTKGAGENAYSTKKQSRKAPVTRSPAVQARLGSADPRTHFAYSGAKRCPVIEEPIETIVRIIPAAF
jgi:hypothetical protein